jgi:hypothetical protein
MSASWRNTLRVAVVILLGLFGAAENAADFSLPWNPYATFGFSSSVDGRISKVEAGSQAAKAGLKEGDRIDVAALGLHARRRLTFATLSPPNLRITFPVMSGNTRRNVTLVSVAMQRTLFDNVSDIVETLERAAFLVIAAVLVLLRPSLLTWSFFLIAFSVQEGVWTQVFLSDRLIMPYTFLANASETAGAVASVIFAMLFPRTEPSPAVRRSAIALALFGVALVAFDSANGYSLSFGWMASGSAAWATLVYTFSSWSHVGLNLAAIAVFGLNYLRSPSQDRLRMQWVALGFAVGSCGTIMPSLIGYFDVDVPLIVLNVLLALTIFTPLSVAYAIVKHRVIDIRFFLSRALVYSLVTTVAVAALALIEFVIAQSLEATRLGLVVEIAGAVAIGLCISRLHRLIDGFVERYVFRSVYQAEQHLTRIGEAMMFARSPRSIDEMLTGETERALRLASVTVVREFDPDEPLALRLLAGRETLDHGDLLAMPLLIRHRLFGYVLYGHHTNGSAIDPNERALLEKITARASNAYDHITSEEKAAENERLRIEVDVLRSALRPITPAS